MNEYEALMDGPFPAHVPGAAHQMGGGAMDCTERGYRSAMIERAIRADSVAMIDAAIKRGWLSPECRCFDNSYVVDYCERQRGAVKVAAHLRSLGYPAYVAAVA